MGEYVCWQHETISTTKEKAIDHCIKFLDPSTIHQKSAALTVLDRGISSKVVAWIAYLLAW